MYNQLLNKYPLIPYNRTIIGLKLTQRPTQPVPNNGFNSIEDVFKHFKPFAKVDLFDEEGAIVEETFMFEKISDFSKESLLAQSTYLQRLSLKISSFREILKRYSKGDGITLSLFTILKSTKGEILQNGQILYSNGSTSEGNNKIEITQSVFIECIIEIFQKKENEDNFNETIHKLINQTKAHYAKNFRIILDTIKDLETSYLGLKNYFTIIRKTEKHNITIFNVDIDRLKDLDNPIIIHKIQNELLANNDRLDLRCNYSLLVLPGYLGSKKVLEKWAKIAYQNIVILVTDFAHVDDPEHVIEEFDMASLSGSEIYHKNVIITANWLLGREKYIELEEEEDLFLSPALALAAQLYSQGIEKMSTPETSKNLNTITNEVCFEVKQTDAINVTQKGITIMINEWGKTVPYSNITLYTAGDTFLNQVSLNRLLSYLAKAFIDYINRSAFFNWTPKIHNKVFRDLKNFLEPFKDDQNIIKDYKISNLGVDEYTKILKLEISFVVAFNNSKITFDLTGVKGDTLFEWKQEFKKFDYTGVSLNYSL